jgi:hypothetical protein
MIADTLAQLLAPPGTDAPVIVVPPPLAPARARLRRVPDGWRRVGVHRVGGHGVRAGNAAAFMARARSSALIELRPRSGTAAPTVLDILAADAGATLTGAPRATTMGAVIVPATAHGVPAIVRIGPGAAEEAGALRALAAANTNLPVPLLLSDGVTADVPWVVETRLPGSRPRQVTPAVIASASTFVAQLPRSSRPTAWRADIDVVRTHAPEWSARLDAVAALLHAAAERVPGLLRHGDLWAGNLLVDRDDLRGVIDWDVWQPDGFPGTDLLHLLATAERHRRKASLGTVVLDQPWNATPFRAAPLWSALDLRPEPDVLEAIGIAYWLGQVAGDLRRGEHAVTDRAWMASNVDAVLASRVLPG